MIPQQPSLIATPFAQNGNKNAIPASNNGAEGLASMSLGFPPITETPVAIGGMPPQRKDFNGILYILSAFAFYQQSGGIFSYSATANYSTPAVIQYNNVLWFCVQENGVDSLNGVKTPGTDTNYWVRLIDYLIDQATRPIGVPVGTIIMWSATNNPTTGTWLDCNGQSCANYPALVSVLGSNTVPNLQGLFPRCAGSQNLSVTINGTTSTQAFNGGSVGTKKSDAIRNITGDFVNIAQTISATGAIYTSDYAYPHIDANVGGASQQVHLDASKVVPVDTENRPASVALRFLIRAA